MKLATPCCQLFGKSGATWEQFERPIGIGLPLMMHSLTPLIGFSRP